MPQHLRIRRLLEAAIVGVLVMLAGLAAPPEASALFVPPSGSDTVLPNAGDDFATGAHALGFTFPFFGGNQTQVFMNSNGNLSFGAGNSTFSNPGFPAGLPPTIAPFWDDLLIDAGDMRFSNATAGVFAAIWSNVSHFSGLATLTFEAVLLGAGNPYGEPSGTIIFSYDLIDSPGNVLSPTVGLNAGNGAGFATLSAVLGTAANGTLTNAQAETLLTNATFTCNPVGAASPSYACEAGGPTQQVPFPATLVLLGVGVASVAGLAWRRSRN
jgi:hypothetical protein